MARALAIQTVGTTEIQQLFDEYLAKRMGSGEGAKARAIGEVLAGFDDAELVQLLSDDVVRNGACYAELDGRFGEDWALALIASDQEPPHDTDTCGIAAALRRWFAGARPGVRVLEPHLVTGAPHHVTEPLGDEILAFVR